MTRYSRHPSLHASWREQLDDNMVKLESLPIGDERSAVVAQGSAFRSATTVHAIVERVRSAS